MIFLNRIFIFFSTFVCIIVAEDLKMDLEYSFDGSRFSSFGSLSIKQGLDGNYTGSIKPNSGLDTVLLDGLKDSAKNGGLYYLRSGDLLTSNFPCLFLRSNLAHSVAVTVDQERGSVESLTLFPQGIYDAPASDSDCSDFTAEGTPKLTAKVTVTSVQELPSPDTVTYLQKIEDEKRSRQHGAAQDNRSFLAKYWMYIVPVVIFMVISGAMGGEEGLTMDQPTSYSVNSEEVQEGSQPSEVRVVPRAQTSQPTEPVSMRKVNEVFATASLAFQRLSDLVLHIRSAPTSTDEQKWTPADADLLANSMKRFCDDCEELSKRLRERTGHLIKTDFKRRTILLNNQQIANPQGISSPNQSPSVQYNGSVAGTSASGPVSYSIGQKRPGANYITGPQPRKILASSTIYHRSVGGTIAGQGGVIRPQRIISQPRVIQPGGQAAQRYYEQVEVSSPSTSRTTGNSTQF
ncbi:hypothetical protein FO519_002654 [Halicephalobus sp. NKZ332]|nr:hypothetical protein FO519_002654 [Halicephalobus sp. NKZ332]